MKKVFTILALLPTLCFGQWTQIGNAINGQTAFDRSGNSCAISADGNIVAIGSSSSDASFSNAGQVRVFQITNGIWTQIGADINGESSGDRTGQSVSLSLDGSILAIGEPANNDLGFISGQVRVYKNINNNWTQIGQDLYGQTAEAGAGRSVDLSDDGSVLAFGAPNTTVNGVFFAGKVSVFENQNNNWVQKGGDIDGDGTIVKFGESVSLSDDGNIIAIGQSGDPINNNPQDTGRVKIYQYINNQWVQLGNTIRGDVGRDEFGLVTSLSDNGNIVAIGTFGQGTVKVLELINSTWTQIGNTLVGNSTGDFFGCSLSLSGDGTRLAVGARFISVNQPGSAYVLENQGGNWVQIDSQIIGVGLDDQAGSSVALTKDGSKVAVGSPGNDNAVGSNAGHVRVFENSSVVGVNNVDYKDEVNAIPNPAVDFITIHSRHKVTSYNLVSIDGRLIKQKDGLNLSEFPIDIHDLTSGLYILTIQTQGGKSSLKIVKQ
jgi:hypothetical protein